MRDYFALSRRFVSAHGAQLIAVGGLSGSGKSAVARAIAPAIGAFPGAVIVRSDVARKRLLAVDFKEKLPARAYAPEVSDEVYAMCRKRAALALAAGRSVIVDAVHAKPEERNAVGALAQAHGADFTGLWLDAPAAVMQDRVAHRQGDVSDATPQVVESQLAYELGQIDFHRIDAGQALDAVAEASLAHIAAKA